MINFTNPIVWLVFVVFSGLFLSAGFLVVAMRRETDATLQRIMIGVMIFYSLFGVIAGVWSVIQ